MNTLQKTPVIPNLEDLKIQTLGQTEVLIHGQIAKWHSGSAHALFYYLLSHPNGKSREEIIDTLWNTEPTAALSNRFRVTIHRIRNALGWFEALLEKHSRYQLDHRVLEACDTHKFNLMLRQAEHASNPAIKLEYYQQALALYTGDYLPFETASWVLKTRNEHNAAFNHAKIAVSQLHCNLGQCRTSVTTLGVALQNDPFLSENHHQKLMSCLSVVEDKFVAIEHYRHFLAFLKNDLNDSPMPETIVIAERIKGGERICLRALQQANTPKSTPM